MTLLLAILTKNASFRTLVYLLRAHIPNINMRTYITKMDMNEVGVFVQTRII